MTDEEPEKGSPEPPQDGADTRTEEELLSIEELAHRRLEELKEKVSDAAVSEGDHIDAEFEDRLNRLQQRASDVKDKRDREQRIQEDLRARDQASSKGLGVGLSAAYIIVGTPLFGAFIGWLIDQNQNTNIYKGLGLLAGAVLGITMVFILLSRENQSR